MDKFVVKKNSFSHKFLTWACKDYKNGWERPKDFCSYWRLFCLQLLKTIILVLGSLSMILFVGTLSYGIPFAYFLYSVFGIGEYSETFLVFANTISFISVVVHVVIACFFILIIIFKETKEWRREIIKAKPKKEKTPNIIYTKYKSWKEKHCPLVEYE